MSAQHNPYLTFKNPFFFLLKPRRSLQFISKQILITTIFGSLVAAYTIFQMIRSLDGKRYFKRIKNALSIPLDLIVGKSSQNSRPLNQALEYSSSDEDELRYRQQHKDIHDALKTNRMTGLFKWTGLVTTNQESNEMIDELPRYPYKPLKEPTFHPLLTIHDTIVTVSIKERGLQFSDEFIKKRLFNEKVIIIEVESLESLSFEAKRELLRKVQMIRLEHEQINDLKVNLEIGTYDDVYFDEKGARYIDPRPLGGLDILEVSITAFKGFELNIRRCNVHRFKGTINSKKNASLIKRLKNYDQVKDLTFCKTLPFTKLNGQ